MARPSVTAAMARPDGTAAMLESQVLDRLDGMLAARAVRAADIERVSATVRRLVQEQDERSQVRAPVAGTVIAIDAAEGTAVERGAPLAEVAPAAGDGRVRCIATMRDAEPGRIAEGMRVRVSPAGTRPEIHGFVRGVVERVARPGAVDAPEMVVILIDADAATPSGLAWVGGSGLPDAMPPVSRAEILVTVDEVAPITLAMPWLARQ